MSKSRWDRVKKVVDEALEQSSPFDRSRFLDEACRGDSDLRHEVESLLAFENAEVLEGSSPPLWAQAPTKATDQRDPPTRAKPSAIESFGDTFVPGKILASRYRIIERVGRGGMGDVYHAEDLTLELPVALKFLPAETAGKQRARKLFRDEVRMARQVTHPNVCRVYDITEVDELLFISMEYIRGEDLRSLLRRIGRLPSDKALDIAVQLASGLAAAHDIGVLHRDLKPGNVMLDDRGHARITDFGLAVAAGDVARGDIRSGTPGYMAPEQRDGQEVTERSDIYSLGLVLYEIITGKRAFDNPREPHDNPPMPPSDAVSDLDPSIDRVILQCLEYDPSKRPQSAAAVRAALPGGDPLAIAIARGETPAPRLLAEAGQSAAASPTVAWACLIAVVLSVVAVLWIGGRSRLSHIVPLPKSPTVLVIDARNILDTLGYPTPQRDRTFGFTSDTRYIDHLLSSKLSGNWWELLARGDPGLIRFWYRESPRYLVPNRLTVFFPTELDPPPSAPGMVRLQLDTKGRLRQLQAMPPTSDADRESSAATRWEDLFTVAGLDIDLFVPSTPKWIPSTYADERAAWGGAYPDAPEIPIRIEAASFRGRVVDFRIVEPWGEPSIAEDDAWFQPADVVPSGSARIAHVAFHFVFIVALGLLARRNLRLGRSDRKLAFRLASLLFGVVMLSWLLAAHHVPELSQLEILFGGLYRACFVFGLSGLLYLALEPYARKLWPLSLVSWVRLLDGRFRDPTVGLHVLVGCAVGTVASLVYKVSRMIPGWTGGIPPRPDYPPHPAELLALRGVREAFAELLTVQVNIVTHVMFLFVALLLLRLLFRRTSIAVAVHWTLYVLMYGPSHGYVPIALTITAWHLMLFRFGWVTILVATFVMDMLSGFPLTADIGVWYGYSPILVAVVCLGLAIYGFKVSLAGGPAFRDLLAD